MHSLAQTRLITLVSVAAFAGVLAVAPVVFGAHKGAAGREGSTGAEVPPHSRHLDIDAFMTGLACTESGGRYTAENAVTGAYGKYQIMPRIWTSWAARYLHNRWARPTPRNQEYVARQRITDLWELRGRWRLVAHWWLTGSTDPRESLWSRGALGYVDRVMQYAHLAAAPEIIPWLPLRCAPGHVGAPNIRTKPWPRIVVTAASANLRPLPADGHPIATAHRGNVFARLATVRVNGREWLRVGLHDGSTAWIAGRFVSPR